MPRPRASHPPRVPMLKMTKIGKVYRTGLVETAAIEDLTVEIARGDFVSLMGPSGSGKTTFLNIAGLLDTFDRGRYLLDGVDVTGLSDDQQSRLRNERIGFIFQSFNLIPDLDVYDNIEAPPRYRRLPPACPPANGAIASRRCWCRWACPRACATCPPSCPAASSSASRSRAPWWDDRSCCSPTSRPATWTRSRRARCWTSSTRSTPNGR